MHYSLGLLLLLGTIGKHCAEAVTCACATTSVHVRSGPGTTHSQIGTTYPGFCFVFKGDESKASGYEWAHIDFKGKDGWIAENYVQMKKCPSSVNTGSGSTHTGSSHTGTGSILSGVSGCPRILSKHEWGARTPKAGQKHLYGPMKYVFIHHGASQSCHMETACKSLARLYQADHMDSRGFNDVGYSFLIGEDGNVYEGRGWDILGAHTKGHNSIGYGFVMMGNYMERLPDHQALTAVKQLIACGVRLGKIKSDYILEGHRDVGATACPGNKLYQLIRTWPHYHH